MERITMIEKPIITIKEARKILGKTANNLTDQDIEKLVDDVDHIAIYAIKNFKELNQS